MTHQSEQRWVATPSEIVTDIIMSNKDNHKSIERWHRKIDYGFEPNDCWVWRGALSDEGYGDFWLQPIPKPYTFTDVFGGRTVRAHRVGYMWKFGPPDEATPFLDHVKCVGRFCVNPNHLEPVSNKENTIRGRGVGAGNQRVLRSEELARRALRRSNGEEEIF